jgi:hypothetical protein
LDDFNEEEGALVLYRKRLVVGRARGREATRGCSSIQLDPGGQEDSAQARESGRRTERQERATGMG